MNLKFLRNLVFVSSVVVSFNAFSAISSNPIKTELLQKYAKNYQNKKELEKLRSVTLNYGSDSVEALMEVMKNGKYPEKNRWIATFLLGQIVGNKASPFISKFTKHPNWVMRLASLKSLLQLKEERYIATYASLLKDESLIVRSQALENIRTLKLKKAAPEVWAMLYDKRNYSQPKKSKLKRSHIIKEVIKVVGELEFTNARAPLMAMIQKDRYNDIFPEMDEALSRITQKKSLGKDFKEKRRFWDRQRLDVTID